ncbi:MAG: GAF domain-containing protein [Candidatus Sericytochromatia bacterium]|nr:GAF domain-containing protein [Candidatus Tanganyikabacteria bacterium]
MEAVGTHHAPQPGPAGLRRLLLGITLLLALPVILTAVALGWGQVGKPFEGFLMQRAGYLAPYQRAEWAGIRAGLQPEDVVIAVDGRKVVRAEDVHRHVAGLGAGKTASYQVVRAGKTHRFDVPVDVYRWTDLTRDFVGLAIVGLCYLVVGGVAAWLRPAVPAARGVWFMGLSLGIFCISYFDANSTYAIALFCVTAISAIGAAFMYLAMIFPQEIGIVRRFPKVAWLPFAAGAGFAAANWIGYTSPGLAAIPAEQFHQNYAMIRYATVWLFFGLLAYLLLLPIHYFKAGRGTLQRQQAAICIAGAFLAFAPVGLLFGVPFVLERPPVLTLDLAILSIIMFPASIAYAIVRHRLFDIEFVIRRSALYSALTLILGTVYVAISTALQHGIVVGAGMRGTEAGLFATAIVVALFVPLRDRLRESIDRRFFRQAYDSQRIIEEVSTSLISLLELEPITTRVLKAAQEALHASGATLYLRQPRGDAFRPAAWAGGPRPADLAASHPIAIELDRGELLSRLILPVHKRHRVSDKLEAIQAEVAVPLAEQGRTIGFLALGPNLSEKPYNDTDLGLLITLANQAAVAVSNALRLEQLERARDSLARSEKLAALGKLAAGVAHELNTPLGVIRGQLQLIGKNFPTEDFQRIDRQLDKMERIVRDLLDFGRPAPPRFEAVDARQVVDRVISLLRVGDSRLKRMYIRNDIESSCPRLRADPSRLEQIFMNLIVNAAHATSETDDPEVTISAEERDDMVVITVEDNGCGIAPEDIRRIFDPFFTTRGVGEGTGLGLSVTFGLVEEHGGWIEAQSRRGEGTRMQVALPVAGLAATARAGD